MKFHIQFAEMHPIRFPRLEVFAFNVQFLCPLFSSQTFIRIDLLRKVTRQVLRLVAPKTNLPILFNQVLDEKTDNETFPYKTLS